MGPANPWPGHCTLALGRTTWTKRFLLAQSKQKNSCALCINVTWIHMGDSESIHTLAPVCRRYKINWQLAQLNPVRRRASILPDNAFYAMCKVQWSSWSTFNLRQEEMTVVNFFCGQKVVLCLILDNAVSPRCVSWYKTMRKIIQGCSRFARQYALDFTLLLKLGKPITSWKLNSRTFCTIRTLRTFEFPSFWTSKGGSQRSSIFSRRRDEEMVHDWLGTFNPVSFTDGIIKLVGV